MDKKTKLIRQLERKQEQRDLDKKRDEHFNGRNRMIAAAPEFQVCPAWCVICQKDFEAPGYKVVLAYPDGLFAKYQLRCPKGHECVRRISDKVLDPYWRQSEMLRKMRAEHEKDLLQPGDPGFQTLYGNPYKEYEDAQAYFERQEWERIHRV